MNGNTRRAAASWDAAAGDDIAMAWLQEIWSALGGDARGLGAVGIAGEGGLQSAFAVSDLAAAAIAVAGLAAAELMSVRSGEMPTVRVDRRLASLWFGWTLRPQGWSLPSPWDPFTGDYEAADGWVRLHANAPHHREAALSALDVRADREAVARAVAGRLAEELETAVTERGGCAAALRSGAQWAAHPQGASVAGEPLLWLEATEAAAAGLPPAMPGRPLAGLRVLDLTRVLAGPVATRFLAMLGAEVLRIDSPSWDEPGVVPEVTLGKRCARLDLRRDEDRQHLAGLLRGADILVHGYRPGALAKLGFDGEALRRLRPGLVDVSLAAYGWTGPWAGRRGFDSLVQTCAGIAAEGMRRAGAPKPVPLPVQALDHATGYLMAAAAIRGITRRLTTGRGSVARCSLARTARLLWSGTGSDREVPLLPAAPADYAAAVEATPWGPAQRLLPPLAIDGVQVVSEHPAARLGSAAAAWSS